MATPQWRTPTTDSEFRFGLDKKALPFPWFMVEHRSDKFLFLDFAMGKLVKSITPHIADIKELRVVGQSREFLIMGKLPGPARIEVRDPRTKRLETALDVSVKRPRRMSVSFHFVEDKVGDRTTRKFDDVEGIIRKLNGVYEYQTYIRFASQNARPLKVDVDLHDVLDSRWNDKGEWVTNPDFIYGEKMWRKIFATKRDPGAHFNVYFVPAEEPKNPNALLFFDLDNCVIEDGVTVKVEYLFTHAIGRMFGCKTSRERHHLMFWGPAGPSQPYPDLSGGFIPKECANLMNP